jgi:hypothetical protein
MGMLVLAVVWDFVKIPVIADLSEAVWGIEI